MKPVIAAVLILLLLPGFVSGRSGHDPGEEENAFLFDDFLIHMVPGGEFFPFMLENYLPGATLLIEESNGFSLLDNPRVYYEGNSFVHFGWYYNGFDINSALNPGSPAVTLPFSAITGMEIRGESPRVERPGFHFHNSFFPGQTSRLTASAVFPDLGGYSSWATFMVHNHASLRDRYLYDTRRRFRNNVYFDYTWHRRSAASAFKTSISYISQSRDFNDFNSLNGVFSESGSLLSLDNLFALDITGGTLEFNALLNLKDRDRVSAELGRLPQETVGRTSLSFFTGLHLAHRFLESRLSLLYEQEKTEPFQENFSKDLLDNDGEGLWPFLRLGKTISRRIDFSLRVPLLDGGGDSDRAGMDFFGRFGYGTISGTEEQHDFNPILFNGSPYLVILWQPGNGYQNHQFKTAGGIRARVPLIPGIVFLGKLFYQHYSLKFSSETNHIRSGGFGYDLGLLWSLKRTRLLFCSSRAPYDYSAELPFFLERSRPTGTIHYWQDSNQDFRYATGEQGDVFGMTGGESHFVNDQLQLPEHRRHLVVASFPLGEKWQMTLKGIYKRMLNSYWVEHENTYGVFEKVDDYNLFFYTRPFEDFTLTNAHFEKDPFYAEFIIRLDGAEARKWFYSFSFMAHIGMGNAAFGNGAGANDIGLIAESQANPNTLINGYGRLDGDRGYVAKMYFGFYLRKNLFLAVSLKYRDGNPFAFLEYLNRYDQWVLYYQTIQAENEKGIKGGPREDYVSDISLKLSYRLRLLGREANLSLSAFNVIDFGSELSEYVFSGGSRDAMELQIPRSIRFTLMVYL